MPFHFPPYIENKIFELAISSRPFHRWTDAQMALVSKRVRSCVEPILYRTLIIGGETEYDPKYTSESKFLPALRSKPASFFQKAVKNLLLLPHVTDKFRLDILSVCTGVENLGLHDYPVEYTDEKIWNLVTAMPLRSLDCGEIIPSLLSTRHVFPHLSYLSLDHELMDEEYVLDKEVFKYIPSLTHLAVRVTFCEDNFHTHLKTTLTNVPRLKSIILFLDDYTDWGDKHFDKVIKRWMALDNRIKVVDTLTRPSWFWRERITTGSNDISYAGQEFKGHFPTLEEEYGMDERNSDWEDSDRGMDDEEEVEFVDDSESSWEDSE